VLLWLLLLLLLLLLLVHTRVGPSGLADFTGP
jgi:hypothetical protein